MVGWAMLGHLHGGWGSPRPYDEATRRSRRRRDILAAVGLVAACGLLLAATAALAVWVALSL